MFSSTTESKVHDDTGLKFFCDKSFDGKNQTFSRLQTNSLKKRF